ncbi:Di-copper centre-containing protein [Westerdykella ornata]|uniref:Di-copper centre-containing protein n=1 Tax=Westerdykella ornata TaxID=318751 RepID=A0A6A6JT26_WESOR|nr:Di-copper centre-containing protein [Westerdykella ornata]KAF2279722.1 Di-copper centre-containing protein [Westerdykella ornata]
MKLSLVVLSLVSIGLSAPFAKGKRASCTSKTTRKSWHSLTREEKLSYIEAEKCLMSKPAKLGLTGARTLFDELQLFHVYQTPEIHGVGAFLPYHRFFVHAHEHLLKTECNYTGGQPYWNEALDAGNFSTSIVLDPETGFGGNGVAPSNCIQDGPFKDYVNAIGPGEAISDHCIDRIVNECMSVMGNSTFVNQCMQMQDYKTFWPCVEAAPHSAGHGGIGGQMMNVFSSPGDPLFYLHHAYLDKLWADWQSQNLSARLLDISGTNRAPFPPFSFPLPGNDPGNVTTLSHVLTVYGAVPNVTIADVMDIQGGTLCYEYV